MEARAGDPEGRSCHLRVMLMYERLPGPSPEENNGSGGSGSNIYGSRSTRSVSESEVKGGGIMQALLPINSLRNVALLAADTPLVAMIDVDLLLDRGLAEEMRGEERR